jgi:hypothetical protein
MFISKCKPTFAAMLIAMGAGFCRADDIRPLARSVAEGRAKLLAPFIDEQTIGVARIEVSEIDAERLFEVSTRFMPAGHPLLQSKTIVAKFVDDFKQAGGRELYLVASLADLPEQPPFLLVPLYEDSDEKALSIALAAFETPHRIGNVLFVGSQVVRKRLMEASPETRPELLRAWEAGGDAQLQIIFMPSANVRRVAEELMPVLPERVGGGPTRTISRGALWAALAVNRPPEIGLRLIIQSQDASAAAAFRAQWRDTLVRAWPLGATISDTITPQVKNARLTLQLQREQIEGMASLIRPAVQAMTESSRRRQSTQHLKQVGLGMHSYENRKKHFPPAAIADADGQPLLSWRVAVLPHLGEGALFQEFHLDEPWDSDHNHKLINRMPAVFRSFGSAAAKGQTCYVVPVGSGSVFDGQAGTAFSRITDGASNTVMAIEVDDEHAVTWTKPDDYKFDPKHPAVGLSSPYPTGMLALFCDGSVRFLKQPLADETLRRIFVCDDGEPVPDLR